MKFSLLSSTQLSKRWGEMGEYLMDISTAAVYNNSRISFIINLYSILLIPSSSLSYTADFAAVDIHRNQLTSKATGGESVENTLENWILHVFVRKLHNRFFLTSCSPILFVRQFFLFFVYACSLSRHDIKLFSLFSRELAKAGSVMSTEKKIRIYLVDRRKK